jgi:hypothetical protein
VTYLSVHVVQLVNWALQEVREDMLPLYVSMAWDLMPLLSSSCSSYTLQGERDGSAARMRQNDSTARRGVGILGERGGCCVWIFRGGGAYPA